MLTDGPRQLKERQALLEQTVYVRTDCGLRYLDERRCEDCNLMCRKVGLGGCCPACDEIIVPA